MLFGFRQHFGLDQRVLDHGFHHHIGLVKTGVIQGGLNSGDHTGEFTAVDFAALQQLIEQLAGFIHPQR